jgi:hypothetical protein
MGSQNHKGQALIELLVLSLTLLSFFFLAIELSKAAVREQSKARFSDQRIKR